MRRYDSDQIDRTIWSGVWATHGCNRVRPEDMATEHLFNAARMIYNHSVPARDRVPGGFRYTDVPTWGEDYRRAALSALLQEFGGRGLADWKMYEPWKQMNDSNFMKKKTTVKGNKFIPVGDYYARVEGESLVIRAAKRANAIEIGRFTRKQAQEVQNIIITGGTIVGSFRVTKVVPERSAKIGCTEITSAQADELYNQF